MILPGKKDIGSYMIGSNEWTGPLSVTVACLVAMCIVSSIEYFKPGRYLPMDAAGCVGTVLLIMDMGTTERLYIMTTLRVCGTIVGVTIGILLALTEKQIQSHYREAGQLEHRVLGVHDLDWVIILYRIVTVGPLVFMAAVMMKRFPKYASAFLVLSIQCLAGLLAKNLRGSIAVATGGILGSVAAILSVILVTRFNSKCLLKANAQVLLDEILEITQMAIKADSQHLSEFTAHAQSIHKIISHNDSAYDTYAQWRVWTRRECDPNLKVLISAARPLFYQSYALYWSNVASFHAEAYNARNMFCDNQAMFQAHFQQSAFDLVAVLANLKTSLATIHEADSPESIAEIFDTVLSEHLQTGLCHVQDQMSQVFMFNRNTCFSTNAQKWNMTDYLRQLAMISLAMIEYIKAMVCVFETGINQLAHVSRLEMIAEDIDRIRRQDEQEKSVEISDLGTEGKTLVSPLPVNRFGYPPTRTDSLRPIQSPRIVVNHLFSGFSTPYDERRSLLRNTP